MADYMAIRMFFRSPRSSASRRSACWFGGLRQHADGCSSRASSRWWSISSLQLGPDLRPPRRARDGRRRRRAGPTTIGKAGRASRSSSPSASTPVGGAPRGAAPRCSRSAELHRVVRFGLPQRLQLGLRVRRVPARVRQSPSSSQRSRRRFWSPRFNVEDRASTPLSLHAGVRFPPPPARSSPRRRSAAATAPR